MSSSVNSLSIPPGIGEVDCDPMEEICLIKKLLYDNSSPRPLKEFNSENSDAIIESFSSSPIPFQDSDTFMEEIDLFLTFDGSIPQGTIVDPDISNYHLSSLKPDVSHWSGTFMKFNVYPNHLN
uniref:Uncharacterized protein n=1 Tax=Tanacetum cinerariifolium TaxID=118510 RepID=A0A6L2LX81_TANCI|nr:hypothetical protein [Tanacetum cinerariifolium]